MPKITKYKKNTAYQLKFLDHTCGHEDISIIIFIGYFIKETKNAYVFSHWIVEDEEDREDNYEYSAILKKTIFHSYEIKTRIPLQ